MIASFMITFRETLEAALVVGIVWSFLVKTGNRQFLPLLVKGCFAGVAASLLGAYLFQVFAGGFEGYAEQIFEGATMIAGGALLTSMILWMMFRNHSHALTSSVSEAIGGEGTQGVALFSLVFFSILREGIETVLFLHSASIMGGTNLLSGAILGIVVASFLGWGLFMGTLKLNLKTVFNLSSVLLILFAAGLFAHGVHEFQEAGVLPVIVEHVWDINPPMINGTYPAFHEKGFIGSILKGLFGYNGNPTMLEVLTYLAYLATAGSIWVIAKRRKLASSMNPAAV